MRPELTAGEIAAFRRRLVEVATEEYARRGPAGLGLRRLADRLGVSRSTPYRYFRSQAAIIDAVRIAALERLTERYRAAIAAAATPAARLQASGGAYIAFARDEPQAYRLLFALPLEPKTESRAFRRALEAYRAVADAPLIEASRQGLIRGEVATASQVLWASLHGLAALNLAGKLEPGRSLDQLWSALADTLAFGMVPRSSENVRLRPSLRPA